MVAIGEKRVPTQRESDTVYEFRASGKRPTTCRSWLVNLIFLDERSANYIVPVEGHGLVYSLLHSSSSSVHCFCSYRSEIYDRNFSPRKNFFFPLFPHYYDENKKQRCSATVWSSNAFVKKKLWASKFRNNLFFFRVHALCSNRVISSRFSAVASASN